MFETKLILNLTKDANVIKDNMVTKHFVRIKFIIKIEYTDISNY